MPASILAFLMLKTGDSDWAVSVHRDLEDLLAGWKRRRESHATTGIIHVGFDRPLTREFDGLARDYAGRVLVTASAKYALPADFRASDSPVGQVRHLPVFLGTKGWGYLLDEDAAASGNALVLSSRTAEGWVSRFLAQNPRMDEQFRAAGIYSEADYLSREHQLDVGVRRTAGAHRFRHLIGDTQHDPCAFARAAPPWLAERSFDSMDLAVRVANVFATLKIGHVRDLSGLSVAELLRAPNFGRKSIDDLLLSLKNALDEGPVNGVIEEHEAASDQTLLASITRTLLKYEEREQEIIRRRMGLSRAAETLQQIGDCYNLTRERVRQIESKLVKRLRREERWNERLTTNLTTLLSRREFPLPALGAEAVDPWFEGISEWPNALRYILTNFCDDRAHVLAIDGVDYFAFLSQERWESTLREGRRLLESGVDKSWSEDHCRSLVQGLLPEKAREFRAFLWEKASHLCHWSETPNDLKTLTSYGRGAEHVVEAVLRAAERPLHFSEIAVLASGRAGRELDIRRVHNAAAAVGFLMGRGTYGLERHIGLDSDSLISLGEEAEEIVSDGPQGRQWHTSEILAALVERGSDLATNADKYIIDISLQRSGGIRSLGRMVWADHNSEESGGELRIDQRQAIIALLQQAGRPLRAHEIRQRLVAIRGVNEFFQIASVDPLIRVGTGLWGLNDRDIIIKRSDQPKFLDGLVDALQSRGFAIHASELSSGLGAMSAVSARTILSLCSTDPRMRVNQAQHLYLAEWGGPRRESVGEAVAAVISAADHPMSFDEIIASVELRVRRKCEHSSISASLQAIEAVLDHTTDQWSRGVPEELATDHEIALTA
jgi:hypothetical protein